MKRLLCFLIAALALPMMAKAQIPEVMVGDTATIWLVYLPYYERLYNCTYGSMGYIDLRQNKYFERAYDYKKKGGVYCFPMNKGFVFDTISFELQSDLQCKPYSINQKFNVSAIGIDSVTTIAIKYPTITFPIDSQKKGYSKQIDLLSFYNNVADSTLFHDWELVVDTASRVTFNVDSGGAAITSYEEQPFTRKKQLLIRFSTTLVPTDTARTFSATFRTHALKAGRDTIYQRDMTFIMPAMPQNGVKSSAESEMSLTISPNPSRGDATISVALEKPEEIEVAIFDLLGNKKSVVAHGFYPNSVNPFRVVTKQLPEGSYFVRLQVGERVLTKRMIVQ